MDHHADRAAALASLRARWGAAAPRPAVEVFGALAAAPLPAEAGAAPALPDERPGPEGRPGTSPAWPGTSPARPGTPAGRPALVPLPGGAEPLPARPAGTRGPATPRRAGTGPGPDDLHRLPRAGRAPRDRRPSRTGTVALRGAGSSGATTLALRAVAEAQAGGALVAWVDLARSLDPVEAVARGVRLEWLAVLVPGAADEALAMAGTLLQARAVDLLVLDLAGAPASMPGTAGAARPAPAVAALAALAARASPTSSPGSWRSPAGPGRSSSSSSPPRRPPRCGPPSTAPGSASSCGGGAGSGSAGRSSASGRRSASRRITTGRPIGGRPSASSTRRAGRATAASPATSSWRRSPSPRAPSSPPPSRPSSSPRSTRNRSMRLLHLAWPHLALRLARQRDPTIPGSGPLILGGRPWDDGVVLDASPAAVALGVRRGIPLGQAHRLAPEAVFLPPDPAADAAAVEAALDALAGLSPGIAGPTDPADRAFGSLEVQVDGLEALWGPEPDLVGKARAALAPLLPGTPRAGIAGTRFAAALAAATGPGPSAVPAVLVPRGKDATFLATFPASALTRDLEVRGRLARFGLVTIGAVAALPRSALVARFGIEEGGRLHDRANGVETDPFRPRRAPERLALGLALDEPVAGLDALRFVLRRLAGALAAQLDARGEAAGRARLDGDARPDLRPRPPAAPGRRPPDDHRHPAPPRADRRPPGARAAPPRAAGAGAAGGAGRPPGPGAARRRPGGRPAAGPLHPPGERRLAPGLAAGAARRPLRGGSRRARRAGGPGGAASRDALDLAPGRRRRDGSAVSAAPGAGPAPPARIPPSGSSGAPRAAR